MGCFSKFFLFVLNFIVFGIGVGVVVLASLILSHGNEFQTLINEGTFTVPIILLIMGLIVMMIGFFGCFGALRESPCLLYTYASIVLVLLIAQIAVAVYGYMKKDEVADFVSKNMVDVFNKYGGSDNELTQSLDLAQNNLHCCGVFNYTDWYNGAITGASIPSGDVPLGCCKTNSSTCNFVKGSTGLPDSIYTEGCFTLFMGMVMGESLWLIIGAIVLALVQLGCVIIACGIGKRAPTSNVY